MTTTLQMDWNVTRWDLRRKFPDLSEDDLAYIENRMTDIQDRIALRTGKPRQEVNRMMREAAKWKAESGSDVPLAPDTTDESGIPENTTQSGTSALSI